MRKIFFSLFILVALWSCSTTVDTTSFSAEEHLQYAQKLAAEGDYEVAVREFQSILLQYAGSPVNDDAQYFLGITYAKREQYLLAAYEFSKLIRDIPASEFVQDAQFMLADSYYQQSPNFQLEQSYTKKAVEEFQAFIEFFPTHPKVSEAEKKIQELNHKFAQKEFHNAEIYERMEYYNAAIKYFTQVYETYHDTEFAPKALYRKIMLLVEKDRVDESLRSIADYIEKYPKNDKVEELEKIKTEMEAEFNG
ncbi:MAG: outer membrane protein assembly factor BamD [Melioribacteraceae bacterium]